MKIFRVCEMLWGVNVRVKGSKRINRSWEQEQGGNVGDFERRLQVSVAIFFLFVYVLISSLELSAVG